jgi:D-xylose transport system permease protein
VTEPSLNSPPVDENSSTKSVPGLKWWRERSAGNRGGEAGSLPVILGLVVVWIFFQTQNSNFLTSRNLSNLILQMAVTAILSMAVVLVLLASEIDLSLGSVTGVTSALLGALLANDHWSATAAIGAALLLGLGIGLLQGLVTVLVGVPSFIVTLGGFLAWAGLQLALIGPEGDLPVTNGTVTAIANDYLAPWIAWTFAGVAIAVLVIVEASRFASWRRVKIAPPSMIGTGIRIAALAIGVLALVDYLNHNFGVPYLLVLILGIAVALGWVTRRTMFGRYIYAVGGNIEASRRAGVPVRTVRIVVLGVSGLLGGIAGIVSTSSLYATSAGVGGSTLLLEAIAAAVIGGVSLFGGRGRIYQALLGSLVIASIVNGLDLLGQSASTEDIATGVILVLAVSLDAINRRRRAASGA